MDNNNCEFRDRVHADAPNNIAIVITGLRVLNKGTWIIFVSDKKIYW